ncbi:MAG: amidase [Hyphomicrobiaceae bacterium TMED74]|nr:amidase [Filomicrobium sp.]RPG40991.1 MAG: amidase [Hyphomicrobiaceae bacterium TMED74]
MSELWSLEASEVAARVRSREVSALEVCDAALSRIDAVNPDINAIVHRTDDEARAAAKAVDEAIAKGDEAGPLAGVPVTIKVNTDQAGYANTNGLRLQENLIADQDSPVVSNLRQSGAVIVGRTNTPAFSLRWFTRNGLHGHTRNPLNMSLTPGGSSGGAAAAVASGMCAIGHGTDIGGSIRYPAYACGLQGLRPTLGRIAAANFTAPDRHIGAQLMAVSGPITRSVADLRLGLAAMSQKDLRDPWWTPAEMDGREFPKRAALTVSPEGLRVDPRVESALREAAARLADAGWEIVETDCPSFREPARLQAQLWLAEFRRTGAKAIEEEADPDSSFVYAQMERLCPAPGLDEFMDALQKRVTLLREWSLFLDDYPVLICPVSGEVPFPDLDDVVSPDRFDEIMEAQLTQVGLPLMSLPGLSVFTGMEDGIPVGAQLIGGRYKEDVLLQAAAEIEARSPKIQIATPAA